MRVLGSLSRQLAPLTLAGAVVAYLYPPSFLIFGDVFLWFFAATMLALGVVLEPEDLRSTLRKPGRVLLGVLTQFTVMPLLGFLATLVGDFPPELALGFIIVGAAPGAMASNVIVYLAGGALAFSIAMTTVATFASPLLTPSLVKLLGGALLPIAFWPLMRTILSTVLAPLLLGMTLKRLLGKRSKEAEIVCPAVAAVAIVVICSYAVAANQERIATVGPAVFGFVVVMNALGYVAGWTLAKLYRFDRRHQLALSIEIGMQNAGLGVALALEHFSPVTALPGALFAAWCVLTAAGASAYLRRQAASEAPDSDAITDFPSPM
ncbi:MAG TPA: bile acid:sodium symporter family protein [Vicinamibacteria bacterium]|nr:bile acid:sodium symporter family protein [Vicinamibacteria bacterium]